MNTDRSNQWQARLASITPQIQRVVEAVWLSRRPPEMAAEDLSQITFIELSQMPTLLGEPDDSVVRIASVIAKRRAVDAIRRSEARSRSLQELAQLSQTDVAVPLDDELQTAIRAAVEELSVEDRVLLDLRFRDDLKLIEIAAVQNRSIQSVFVAIRSAMARLRTRLRQMAERDDRLRELLDKQWPDAQ